MNPFSLVLTLLITGFPLVGCLPSGENFATHYSPAESQYGTVRGSVSAATPGTIVTLENHLSLFTTHADEHGNFDFHQVLPGDYLLHVFPGNGENSWDGPQVQVRAGECTDAGIILPPAEIPLK